MYMKDLKHKMTLRLNDDLLNYVTSRAESVGLSPSDFIRQCIGMHKDAYERAKQVDRYITCGGDRVGRYRSFVSDTGMRMVADTFQCRKLPYGVVLIYQRLSV